MMDHLMVLITYHELPVEKRPPVAFKWSTAPPWKGGSNPASPGKRAPAEQKTHAPELVVWLLGRHGSCKYRKTLDAREPVFFPFVIGTVVAADAVVDCLLLVRSSSILRCF
jgi:hypothetical protein